MNAVAQCSLLTPPVRLYTDFMHEKSSNEYMRSLLITNVFFFVAWNSCPRVAARHWIFPRAKSQRQRHLRHHQLRQHPSW